MIVRHKHNTPHSSRPMSNYLIMGNNHKPYFPHVISFHSECSFNSHLNVIQSSLSHSTGSTQAHARIHRRKCSPHNPLSTPPPSPSCIPQICPMNESIFSFQHCLNFQLKMSRVSPDCSEGLSITGPQQAPPQACVSATNFFMIILHFKACFKNTNTLTI